jgi:hypothetical protein
VAVTPFEKQARNDDGEISAERAPACVASEDVVSLLQQPSLNGLREVLRVFGRESLEPRNVADNLGQQIELMRRRFNVWGDHHGVLRLTRGNVDAATTFSFSTGDVERSACFANIRAAVVRDRRCATNRVDRPDYPKR